MIRTQSQSDFLNINREGTSDIRSRLLAITQLQLGVRETIGLKQQRCATRNATHGTRFSSIVNRAVEQFALFMAAPFRDFLEVIFRMRMGIQNPIKK